MRLLLLILLFISGVANGQAGYGEKMAATVMQTWKDSFALGPQARWSYDMGVILKGFEGLWMNSGNADYFRYIQKQMDYFVDDSGNIKTYRPDEFNIDHINNGKLLLLLYRVTEKKKYLDAANLLRHQLREHPRTKEGSFWHKQVYPWQVWLDGLYMGQPFYAEYALIAHEDTTFDDIARQFISIEKHTRDAATGLLYHGYDESRQQQWANKETGTSPLFWARAMGWYATALVDVLEYFPQQHPGRQKLIAILDSLVVAISKQQDPTTGVWKDILAYNGEGKERNYFEASASSQFVYAIAKGVRNQWLPARYLEIAKKGYEGIIREFIREENGMTHLHGTVKVSGLGGKPYRDGSFNYYMSEDVIVDDPKGVGAFLLAASEMEIAPAKAWTSRKQVVLDHYFNHETKKDAFGDKIPFHYIWDEKDNNGFSLLGHIFSKNGAATSMLETAPTKEKLKNASVYIIVDPDYEKENPSPAFISEKDAAVIVDYVKNGGVLLLMGNDSGNAEFKHFNQLASHFGIQFRENLRHDVKGSQFEQGAVNFSKDNVVFKTAKQGYIKQLASQTIKSPATSVYSENGETLLSISKLGKGTVFAVGDPWFYNEYVDGRKLPPAYENYRAAEDLVKWLLNNSTR